MHSLSNTFQETFNKWFCKTFNTLYYVCIYVCSRRKNKKQCDMTCIYWRLEVGSPKSLPPYNGRPNKAQINNLFFFVSCTRSLPHNVMAHTEHSHHIGRCSCLVREARSRSGARVNRRPTPDADRLWLWRI
jgi:hypothetical protein